MNAEIRPKVLITKIGLDGHDRGSRVGAAALRDAGMEVIYTPPWQEITTVVKLAIEEDVDVIGISSLATDHLIVPKLMTALREGGARDVAVIVGGIVPDDDEQRLLDAGVARVFHPGSSLDVATKRCRARASPVPASPSTRRTSCARKRTSPTSSTRWAAASTSRSGPTRCRPKSNARCASSTMPAAWSAPSSRGWCRR